MYRQGDILLVPVNHRPENVTKTQHCILAHGEATGHTHQIRAGAELLIDADNAVRYVEVFADTVDLVHEEHRSISLPGPALYQIHRQREYAPDGMRDLND